MKKVIIRVKGNCVVFKGGEKIVIEGPEINLKETDKICIHALASLFFQPFTVPNKDFAQKLMKQGHSVGLHAVHTNNYKVFSRNLAKISKRFDGRVYGFIKHSSVINYDDSERLSGYMNSGFVINNALRRVCLWNYFL